jgi:hydrogenase maturation protease
VSAVAARPAERPRDDSAAPPRARVPVFLCGERYRGDDAAAFLAAELLSPDACLQAEIVPAGQLDVIALMELPRLQPFIVADAVAGIAPGALFIAPLARLAAAAQGRADLALTPTTRSSHQLRIEEALALATLLRDAPLAGTFIGIGAATAGMGRAPSAVLRAALPAFAAAIAAEIARYAGAEVARC